MLLSMVVVSTRGAADVVVDGGALSLSGVDAVTRFCDACKRYMLPVSEGHRSNVRTRTENVRLHRVHVHPDLLFVLELCPRYCKRVVSPEVGVQHGVSSRERHVALSLIQRTDSLGIFPCGGHFFLESPDTSCFDSP